MRFFVTGATGFVGGWVVERLLALGHDVIALVRSRSRFNDSAQSVDVRHGDLENLELLEKACADADCVIHAAAKVGEWGEWRDFERSTVQGTRNLVKSALRVQVRRFVHISTVCVYDDSETSHRRIVDESVPHAGLGDRAYGNYSRSKVMAEEIVRDAGVMGLPFVIARPAWVYGPRDQTILPRLLEHFESPLAFWVGRKDPVVDPIFVSDVVDFLLLAATESTCVGRAYNVSPPTEIRLREFVGLLLAEVGARPPRFVIPSVVAWSAAYALEAWGTLVASHATPAVTRAGVAAMTADLHHTPENAIRDLGWMPKVELVDGVRRTIAWWNQARKRSVAADENGESK